LQPKGVLHPEHAQLTAKHLIKKGLAKPKDSFRLSDIQFAPTWKEVKVRVVASLKGIKAAEQAAQDQLRVADSLGDGMAASVALQKAFLMASMIGKSRCLLTSLFRFVFL
jgi:hypothetical protein